MEIRDITRAQVLRALQTYHTSHPARPPRDSRYEAIVYVSTIDGRPLRVYVRVGSNPPLVATAAWGDE
ncbi:MAG: DUF4258 domain-containing protein [Chloroflexi bacterium]|nr:DUF4258 domain-containing protein [Chloroflexota bacterium]